MNVCAALSEEKINEVTYVKGKTANGKQKYEYIDWFNPKSNPLKQPTVKAIVIYSLMKSTIKLPHQ